MTCIAISDLEGEPFISLAEDTTTRIKIDGAFRAANVSRSSNYEARWSASVTGFVAEGLGCTIIEPFSAQAYARQGGIVRPLGETIDFSFAEVLPKHLSTSNLTTAFLECFHAEMKIFQNELCQIRNECYETACIVRRLPTDPRKTRERRIRITIVLSVASCSLDLMR